MIRISGLTDCLVPVFPLNWLDRDILKFTLDGVYQEGCLGIGREVGRNKSVRDEDERWMVYVHLM